MIWIGLILQYFIGYKLGWTPNAGYCDLLNPQGGCGGPVDWAYHLILPWMTFAILFAAIYVRMIRANVMDTMNEDYVRTARAKGAPESQVMRSHVLRNAMLPVVTMLGMDIGIALGGAIFTETIFGLPGLGKLTVTRRSRASTCRRSRGSSIFATLCIIVFNVLVDVALRLDRSEDHASADGAPRGPGSQDALPHRRRDRQGGRRRLLLDREGQDPRDRRRVGLRQERHLPHDHGAQRAKGTTTTGEALFKGEDLLTMNSKRLREIRGNDIAMIFQDPMTSLNPVHTIGDQLDEAILLHRDVTKRQARARAIELLKAVGIPHAERRLDDYPHQFSGGMRQRVMIAMALVNDPGPADRRRADDRARRDDAGADPRT